MRGVIGGTQQLADLRQVTQFDLEHPAFAVGVLVDQLGGAGQFLVHRNNVAGHRGVDIAGGFDTFDHRAFLAGFNAVAHLRQLDVDDVSQFMLGMVANADDGAVAFDAHPFMGLRIF